MGGECTTRTDNMEWYVYYHDFNAQKIIKWNVFNHGAFKKEINTLLKEKIDKDDFSEKLKREVMYYFWSNCEYEIILPPWIGRADVTKIDIYDQIVMNFGRFVDYCWLFKED